MGKMPAGCAVLAVAALLALSASATAAETGTMESSAAGASKADPIEFSSARRQRRIVRQYWVPRRIGQPYTYGPYHEGYSHDPYGRPNARPYYRPGAYLGFPPGLGFGFGWQ